jgi:hypothetical protein
MTRKRKHAGVLPITGPAACWRSTDIKAPCATCGGRTAPMHSPTRLAGVFCGEHCPCCVSTVASSAPATGKPLQAPVTLAEAIPLPEPRSAVLANAGGRGKGFNKPFGKRFDKYLGTF